MFASISTKFPEEAKKKQSLTPLVPFSTDRLTCLMASGLKTENV